MTKYLSGAAVAAISFQVDHVGLGAGCPFRDEARQTHIVALVGRVAALVVGFGVAALILLGVALLCVALITLFLTFTLLRFLLFAARFLLFLGFGQKANVVFGMLLKVLGIHAVARELGVAMQRLVFVDDLLRGSPHFPLGARAVEHPVDDIPGRTAVALVPGA